MAIITKSYSSWLLNNYYAQIMFLIENKDALSYQSSSLGQTNRIAKSFWYFQSVRYRREQAQYQPCSGESGCGFVSSTLPLRVIPLPARPPRHPVPKPRCFPFHRCVQPQAPAPDAGAGFQQVLGTAARWTGSSMADVWSA